MHLRERRSWLVGATPGSHGDDSVGIHVLVRPEVVVLDVGPITRFANLREFQHSVDKRLEIGVVNNSLKVALEMDHVNEVKPDQRGEQTHVSFGECALPGSDQPSTPLKVVLKLVQSVKQSRNSGVVCRLGPRKSGFVDAVVDRFVVGRDHGINLGQQIGRAKGSR